MILELFGLVLDLNNFLDYFLGICCKILSQRHERTTPKSNWPYRSTGSPRWFQGLLWFSHCISQPIYIFEMEKKLPEIVRVSIRRTCPFGVRVTDIDLLSGLLSNLYVHSLTWMPSSAQTFNHFAFKLCSLLARTSYPCSLFVALPSVGFYAIQTVIHGCYCFGYLCLVCTFELCASFTLQAFGRLIVTKLDLGHSSLGHTRSALT